MMREIISKFRRTGDSMKINLAELYRKAADAKLVSKPEAKDIQRAQRAYKRNQQEPGDCRGNEKLLAALAIAEAEVGQGVGWIPETQRIGCEIAKL